jgi:glycosyltransferase involved in cell wall biosynthesis
MLIVNNMVMEGEVAHTIQVYQMLTAFAKTGSSTTYVWPCFHNRPGMLDKLKLPITRVPIFCRFSSGIPRQLELMARFFVWVRKFPQPTAIFTRNIGLAFTAQFVAPRVGLEIHMDFNTRVHHLIPLLGNRVSFVCISEVLANNLVNKYGVDRKRILVAHDGVEYNHFAQASPLPLEKLESTLSTTFSDPAKIRHLYIGKMEHKRGLGMIAAAAQALPSHQFVLIGGTLTEVHAARQMGLDRPNVVILPAIPHAQVPQLLKAFNSLLMPYLDLPENHWRSPMKLFEYMASGIPIITTKVGGVSEVLSDKEAFMADPNDTNGLIAPLESLVNNPSLGQKKAQQAQILAETSYTWSARAKAIRNFLS